MGRIPNPQPVDDPSYYLEERYVDRTRRARILSLYYGLKPLIPRRLQLFLRRSYAKRQASQCFPRWPIEPVLVERRQKELGSRLRRSRSGRVAVPNLWPDRSRFAFILTHDVESTAGVENIPALLEIEQRHGFVSAWNFVAEDYPIDPSVFDTLRAAGCEIGLHGITHDWKLFTSRAHFEEQLPKIRHYLSAWGAVGFRSPALHRDAEYMPDLGCLYDSSFPDTDPFEPQPGGCCSIWPFFLGDLVELPLTLVQDHTLWEILREESIERWVQKSRWIIRHHGLINILVHPDYANTAERLRWYDEFLSFLRAQHGGWHALPWEVATWWKARPRDVQEVVPTDRPVALNGKWVSASAASARRNRRGEIVIDV